MPWLLGDAVKTALSTVGVTEERVQTWIGGRCNCAGRRKKLNDLSQWAEKLVKGQITEESAKKELDDLVS